jgi:hypothetical protein
MTETRTRDAGWPGVQRVTDVSTRAHAGSLLGAWSARGVREASSKQRPSGRSLSLHDSGLDARWRWIWRNRTLTGDVNVGGSSALGRSWWLNRLRRLGDESGVTNQSRQDGGFGTVRGLQGARPGSAGRFVMHRAYRANAVAARAPRRMRVCRGNPQRDGHERHGPDLAQQPDGRDRHEDPTQMRHQRDLIP